jgi:hypothetical protein
MSPLDLPHLMAVTVPRKEPLTESVGARGVEAWALDGRAPQPLVHLPYGAHPDVANWDCCEQL